MVRDPATTAAERLKWARENARFGSAAEAARAIGVPEPTYSGHENGSRGLTLDAATRYASFYKVSLEWLLTARGVPRGRNVSPVIGYIGGGAQVTLMDSEQQTSGLEYVESPPGIEFPCVAARLTDDTMYPWERGWLVFWARDHGQGVDEECINKICVVKLKDDRIFIKRVRRAQQGRFTLESWNAPPMEDVEILWATRVISINPK